MTLENSGLEAFKFFMLKTLKTSFRIEALFRPDLCVVLGPPRALPLSDPCVDGRPGQRGK